MTETDRLFRAMQRCATAFRRGEQGMGSLRMQDILTIGSAMQYPLTKMAEFEEAMSRGDYLWVADLIEYEWMKQR